MENLDLNEQSCADIIINSLEVGQRKGAFSIKDASLIHKVILFIKRQIIPKDYPNLDKITAFDTLIKAVTVANSKGSYGIDDAALIDKVVITLQDLGLSTKPVKNEEEYKSSSEVGSNETKTKDSSS